MDFTKLDGFKVFYYLVLLLIFVALMVFLLKSAKESLRRTGGKWQSVIDEIFIGFIVLIAFTIIAQIEPSSIISFLTKPLTWIWDLVLKALRFVGVKI